MLTWSDEQRTAFCDAQWSTRRAAYRSAYPSARDEIVQLDAIPVGRLLVEDAGDVMHVIDVALVPEARGRGLGARLLADLQAAARAQGRHVDLYVDPSSPARRLYERLGFAVVAEQGLSLKMSWTP